MSDSRPTVTVYKEKDGWYWVQVDEQGDPWYNKPSGPCPSQHMAWEDAKQTFRKLRELRD